MVAPPASAARPHGPDIETLIDGPTAFGDWNARERRRRWTVVRRGLRLVGLIWFLFVLQLFGTRDSALVLLFSISLVYAVGAGVLTGAGATARGYVVIALYGAFGAVAGTALHYAREPVVVSPLVLATVLVAAGTCVAVSNGFVGWCGAAQDRDILVRRRWRRAWQRGTVPQGASPREAAAAQYGKLAGPVGVFSAILFADPHGRVAGYAPLFPYRPGGPGVAGGPGGRGAVRRPGVAVGERVRRVAPRAGAGRVPGDGGVRVGAGGDGPRCGVAADVPPRPPAPPPGGHGAGGVRVAVSPVRLRSAPPHRGYGGDGLTDSHAEWSRNRGQVSSASARMLFDQRPVRDSNPSHLFDRQAATPAASHGV